MNFGFPIYRLQYTLESPHKHQVFSVKFSRCGQSFASCGCDETIKIWDAAGKLKNELVGDAFERELGCGFIDADWSNDGSLLVSASARSIRIWNVNTGECVKLLGNSQYAAQASFSPDANLILTCSGPATKVWDSRSGVCLNTQGGHQGHVTAIDFDNQASRFVASNFGGFCYVYDLRSMDIVQEIQSDNGLFGRLKPITFARFSPDSRNILYSTLNNTIRLFDLRKMEVVGTYKGHTNKHATCYATFSSTSGRYIVSGSEDHLIYIWDTNTQELVEVLAGHSGYTRIVSYHPEEDIIISGSMDKSIKIWKSS